MTEEHEAFRLETAVQWAEEIVPHTTLSDVQKDNIAYLIRGLALFKDERDTFSLSCSRATNELDEAVQLLRRFVADKNHTNECPCGDIWRAAREFVGRFA